MNKITHQNRLILLIAAMLGFWAIGSEQANAAEARVYLRNRMVPLFIQNIEFHYAREYGSRQTAIFFIKEQRKYISFGFDRIRIMRILGIEGYRSGSPVFKLDLWLNEPGHGMVVQLIPLKMITGLNSGVPWKYKLYALSGYDDKARQIKKIEFIQPQNF
jgi:hypothetical protein